MCGRLSPRSLLAYAPSIIFSVILGWLWKMKWKLMLIIFAIWLLFPLFVCFMFVKIMGFYVLVLPHILFVLSFPVIPALLTIAFNSISHPMIYTSLSTVPELKTHSIKSLNINRKLFLCLFCCILLGAVGIMFLSGKLCSSSHPTQPGPPTGYGKFVCYSASKQCGSELVLKIPHSLVLRTNHDDDKTFAIQGQESAYAIITFALPNEAMTLKDMKNGMARSISGQTTFSEINGTRFRAIMCTRKMSENKSFIMVKFNLDNVVRIILSISNVDDTISSNLLNEFCSNLDNSKLGFFLVGKNGDIRTANIMDFKKIMTNYY